MTHNCSMMKEVTERQTNELEIAWQDSEKTKKSRIRETPTLSTDADSRTNTNLKWLFFFFSFQEVAWKKKSLPLFFLAPHPPSPAAVAAE